MQSDTLIHKVTAYYKPSEACRPVVAVPVPVPATCWKGWNWWALRSIC